MGKFNEVNEKHVSMLITLIFIHIIINRFLPTYSKWSIAVKGAKQEGTNSREISPPSEANCNTCCQEILCFLWHVEVLIHKGRPLETYSGLHESSPQSYIPYL
jgi:hypothetical protein